MLRTFKKMTSALAVVLSATSIAQAASVEWSGFGSAFYGQALTEEFRPVGFTDTSANFTAHSLFGLNLASRLDDNLSLASQIVTSSTSDSDPTWNLLVKWAYLNYRLNDKISFKAGRQLLPAFLASEYASVHFLLPYRTIPASFGATSPFSGFDGFSAAYRWQLSEANLLTVSAFGGSPNISAPAGGSSTDASSKIQQLLGGVVTFDGPGYRAQASYSHSSVELTINSVPAAGQVNHAVIGGRYDRNNIVVWAEYARLWSDNGTSFGNDSLLEKNEAAYGLFGYRIAKFLPRYTLSWNDSIPGLGAHQRDLTHNIGVNYALNDQAVIKLDYDWVHLPGEAGPSAGATRDTGSTKKDGSAVYLGVDFIF